MDTGAGLLVIGVVMVPDTATLVGAAPEVGATLVGAAPEVGVEPVLVTAAAEAAGSMVRG